MVFMGAFAYLLPIFDYISQNGVKGTPFYEKKMIFYGVKKSKKKPLK